jgi:hypothetical protein
MAESILRFENILRTVGKEWHTNFIQRNPAIASMMGRPQESKRIGQATEEVVQKWFDSYNYEVTRYKVQPLNIHNIDEYGMGLGICSSHQVIGEAKKTKRGRPRKETRTTASQTRVRVSIIECISATGFSPQPLIIFKGKSDILNWCTDPPPPFKYTHSDKAWTNNEIAIKWLDEIFIPNVNNQLPMHLDSPSREGIAQFGEMNIQPCLSTADIDFQDS